MDARYTRTDYHDGISRYGASLIEATARIADVTMIISDEAQLKMLPSDIPWVIVTAPTSTQEPWVANQLNAYHPDVVFSPMQTMGSAGRQYGLILTLHDLIYYQHRTPPHDLPSAIRVLWRLYHLQYWPQRMLLDRADAVATVSKTTQRLMRKYRLTRRPIRVISNAASEHTEPRDTSSSRQKNLVYMGSFMRYKNVEPLIQAMRYLPDYTLHLLSPISKEREEELVGLAAIPENIIFHHGVSDDQYREILCSSTALVSLSRSEGFGLPVVEAMSVGTPVILSDLEIFREVGGAGGAARYVPLNDAEEQAKVLAQRVRELEDPPVFEEASTVAVQQSQKFTWDESARRLVSLAEEVARQRENRPAC